MTFVTVDTFLMCNPSVGLPNNTYIPSTRCGKHKIFIGMAPGVGKTCKMLDEAYRLKRDGIDVVVGCVETQYCSDKNLLVLACTLCFLCRGAGGIVIVSQFFSQEISSFSQLLRNTTLMSANKFFPQEISSFSQRSPVGYLEDKRSERGIERAITP